MCGFRVFFIITAFSVIGASSARAESVQEAVRRAVANHPSVMIADATYKAAGREKDLEKSGYYPEVSVSTAVGRVYQDNATSRGLVTERGAAYSGYGEGTFVVRQMLFDGMETNHRVKAADARERSIRSNLGDVEERIALRAVQGYLDVLRARAALSLIRVQRSKITEYEERITSMFDQGAADESELQQARDVGMIMDGVLADYEGQLESARAYYYEAIGAMPDDELVVPSSLEAIVPAETVEAVQIAKNNHYGLRSAKEEARAAGMDIEVARSAFSPDFTGELSWLKSDKKDVIGGENEDQRALVRMNWNFSTGGEQFAEVDKKRYMHREAQARIQEIERQIERDVYQAYAAYHAAARKANLSKERIDLNEKLFAAYEAQFEGSRVSLLHLMRAESQLFNARLEAADNAFRYLTAQYAVLASMGYLTAALDASEIVSAEIHLDSVDSSYSAQGEMQD